VSPSAPPAWSTTGLVAKKKVSVLYLRWIGPINGNRWIATPPVVRLTPVQPSAHQLSQVLSDAGDVLAKINELSVKYDKFCGLLQEVVSVLPQVVQQLQVLEKESNELRSNPDVFVGHPAGPGDPERKKAAVLCGRGCGSGLPRCRAACS